MTKKKPTQQIPCLYQWWKIMGTLDHKPKKIMWTKEFILRHRHSICNQENLVKILNFTQLIDYFEFRTEVSQLQVLMSQIKLFRSDVNEICDLSKLCNYYVHLDFFTFLKQNTTYQIHICMIQSCVPYLSFHWLG